MARFSTLSPSEVADLTTRRTSSGVDLTEHKRGIEQALQGSGGWGKINLEPNDNVRAIKRRTTIAAKEMNKVVKWHRKSTSDALIFQALDPSQVVKRQRRSRRA